MSEVPSLLPVRHVLEVNPDSAISDFEYKALLAMQASAQRGREGFDQANEQLRLVAGQLSVAPTITYEDVVLQNPIEGGAYVMSEDPEVAEQESLFYRTHNIIEDDLAVAIEAINSGHAEIAVESTARLIKRTRELYRNLQPEAFSKFREYFIGLNGYPGASGAFTASIPILDLQTHGGLNRDDERRDEMLENIESGLYPSHQASQLRDLLLSDQPMADMPITERLKLVDLLYKFRLTHKASVHKFMPANRAGSGGIEDIDFDEFLDSMMVGVDSYLTSAELEPAVV